MSAIFDALPGIPVAVGDISKGLARMWAAVADKGGAAPSAEEGKATQVNFVLHFGFATTPADAAETFATAVRFSKRYPCRVVVLCPLSDEEGAKEFRAKIYGECHLGKSKGDKRCCEFVMLSYPISARQYLESQVSICLSTDLPLYYWIHRFSSSARMSDYQYLLGRSKRVMFDSAVMPADVVCFSWPKPDAVRDLAYARLLTVRQSIGQFLSAYAPATLVDRLTAVTLAHRPEFAAEATVLLAWLKKRLADCGAPVDTLALKTQSVADGFSFDLNFTYTNGHRFHWSGDLAHGSGLFEADFGGGVTSLPTAVSLLSPEAALGEAMFF